MSTDYEKMFRRAYKVLQGIHEDLGWAMDDLPWHDDLASARGRIEDFNEDDVPESFDPDEPSEPDALSLLERLEKEIRSLTLKRCGSTWNVYRDGGRGQCIASADTPEAAIRDAWAQVQGEEATHE